MLDVILGLRDVLTGGLFQLPYEIQTLNEPSGRTELPSASEPSAR
jgi:hypothetical protein